MAKLVAQNSPNPEAKIFREVSTLEQNINVPWRPEFHFGIGIDAASGTLADSALQPFKVQLRECKKTEQKYRVIQDESSFAEEIEAFIMGKLNIENVNISSASEYVKNIEYSETALTFIAEYSTKFDEYDVAPDYELTDNAKKLATNPAKFRKRFGDYFIAGGLQGSRFIATYKCKASSKKDLNKFKASFNGGVPDLFSIAGSVGFASLVKENNIDVHYDINMIGQGLVNPPISTPWDIEKIFIALAWFKKNIDSNLLRAELRHYSTIEPGIPRTVDIDPVAFLGLHWLYLDLWNLRALHASLPTTYRAKTHQEFSNINDLIMGQQHRLAVDSDMRHECQQQLETLRRIIRNVYFRMNFYFAMPNTQDNTLITNSEINI